MRKNGLIFVLLATLVLLVNFHSSGFSLGDCIPRVDPPEIDSPICGDRNGNFAVDRDEMILYLDHCCITPSRQAIACGYSSMVNLCECPEPYADTSGEDFWNCMGFVGPLPGRPAKESDDISEPLTNSVAIRK